MNNQNNNLLPGYSVLIQVYDKVPPDQFEQALVSMMTQTHSPVDLVLICDGRLTDEQNAVIERVSKNYPDTEMTVCRFDERITVGMGSNHGLTVCRCELVARMDADDISLPDRCRLQAEQFALDPELDIVGGFIEEFSDSDPENALVREVPADSDKLIGYARRRTPFNNVTVMMRRDAALAVGGYRDLTRAEDYDLYFRMLKNGAKGMNLPEVMVRCRVSDDGYSRRKSWEHAKSIISVRRDFYRMGFTSLLDFLTMSAAHIVVFLMPSGFTQWLYSRHLRKSRDKKS